MPKRYTPLASVVSRDAHDQCTVPRCLRRPMNWGGAYCTRHHHRNFENGHHDATVATIAELAQFSEWVEYGLSLFRNTSAVRIALERAHRLLHFTPTTGAAYERYFAGRMDSVRQKAGEPVDARRLLVTALSYYAFEAAHPERVMNTTVRNIGLARALIRLGRCKQPQPRKSDLSAAGALINDMLGMFAIRFLEELTKRTRKDNLERRREDAALLDFTAN